MVVQDVIRVGSRVRIRDEDAEEEFDHERQLLGAVFTIVAECEADAFADRISAESPFGRALLGHQVGERVRFRAPGGIVGVTVVAVS
jgi:transcription elongation factor GreA